MELSNLSRNHVRPCETADDVLYHVILNNTRVSLISTPVSLNNTLVSLTSTRVSLTSTLGSLNSILLAYISLRLLPVRIYRLVGTIATESLEQVRARHHSLTVPLSTQIKMVQAITAGGNPAMD